MLAQARYAWAQVEMVDESEDPQPELERLRARVRELEARQGIDASIPLGHGLVEREMLMREAERIAELGSWVWDVPEDRVIWSAQMYRILGYDPATTEPSAANFFQRIHPEDMALVEANGRRVASGGGQGGASHDRARVVRPDGSIRHVELDGHALLGPEGAPQRVVGTLRDITRALETDRALEAARSMLTALGEAGGIGSWLWDLDTGELEWSGSMRTLLGLPADTVPSVEGVMNAVHPDDVEIMRQSTAVAMDPGVPMAPPIFRILRPDGEVRHLLHHTRRVDVGEGRVRRLAGLLVDVSERQKLEEQLRQAQKLEAVGSLANGIAHDFNNYLMIASVNIELIQMDLAPEDPSRELLDEVLSATERCQLLIKRLLGFSRKQSASPTKFGINELVEELVALTGRLVGDEIEVVSELSADAGDVLADRMQLEQVLVNLVINARDAMPGGGRLTISSARVELDAALASRLPQLGEGPFTRVVVADTGTGIPEDIQARLFEPFFTTKAPGKGSGLGLSTAYRITKQAGGSLTLDSRVGEGTRFELLLPAVS